MRISAGFEEFGAKCRIDWRRQFGTKSLTMSDGTQLKTSVTTETKVRFAAVARHQGLSESAMLKRLVDLMLKTASAGVLPTIDMASPLAAESRLTVRFPTDDYSLLRERAAARGMPPSTYVAVLTRAHLRNLAPLPKAEYLLLKRAVSELGDLTRRLGSASWADLGDRKLGLSREDARAIFRVCEALRDHVRGLIKANLKSWRQGHAEPTG